MREDAAYRRRRSRGGGGGGQKSGAADDGCCWAADEYNCRQTDGRTKGRALLGSTSPLTHHRPRRGD